MSKESLKTIVHQYIDNSDEKILKVVHTILEQNAQLKSGETSELTEEYLDELDKRWDAYVQKKTKAFTLAEVKAEIDKKIKGAKQKKGL